MKWRKILFKLMPDIALLITVLVSIMFGAMAMVLAVAAIDYFSVGQNILGFISTFWAFFSALIVVEICKNYNDPYLKLR